MRSGHYPQSPDMTLALDTALPMVSFLAGLEHTVHSRYSQLEKVSSLPLEAAALGFMADLATKAVEWLEQGRCLVWGQLNSLRTPVDELESCDRELAQKIREVAKQLESTASNRIETSSDSSMARNIVLESEARAHRDLAKQWENLLTAARALPGFNDFLQPPSWAAILHDIPPSGYVIVINVHGERCDAVVITHSINKPIHIPLPGFSAQKATRYHKDITTQLLAQGLRIREERKEEEPERAGGPYRRKQNPDNRVLQGVLIGLWNEVVKPILDAVGFSRGVETPAKELPRIWWCPTGPLTFLPLHAAGDYGRSKPDGVFNYAVSSYTPTVTALTQRVKNSQADPESTCGIFLTSQPNAIPKCCIPGTSKEVRAIFNLASEYGVKALRLEGDHVTVEECLAHMKTFSTVHLACHASQNAEEPLKSTFRFHKGSLNLGTVLQRNLKNADLAFLSACQTSTGHEVLPDEAVHLAAGMLAAGYRRVVATMWSIKDQHAPGVAIAFYKYLWSHREEGSGSRFDGSLSAYALHDSIQKLRDRLGDDSEESLLAWIPYVHFGY
ncbi:hypothetical protein NMY22_g12827 [Coprinellus aureogranulatus]|nr:hypothetical protein NMY22_g12827 [Coprinellus aureogranulatus]